MRGGTAESIYLVAGCYGKLPFGPEYLDVNVVLNGPVHLADGANVGPNCVLSDVRVGAGTSIKPNCVIERAEIGARCEVGPFTRIRPDTVLADEVDLLKW